MLKKNNSNPAICVDNLMQISRGEVPYDRIKGVGLRIDAPSAQAAEDITEDAEWMLETYEPRAKVESIELVPTDAPGGHFALNANIKIIKEAEA